MTTAQMNSKWFDFRFFCDSQRERRDFVEYFKMKFRFSPSTYRFPTEVPVFARAFQYYQDYIIKIRPKARANHNQDKDSLSSLRNLTRTITPRLRGTRNETRTNPE